MQEVSGYRRRLNAHSAALTALLHSALLIVKAHIHRVRNFATNFVDMLYVACKNSTPLPDLTPAAYLHMNFCCTNRKWIWFLNPRGFGMRAGGCERWMPRCQRGEGERGFVRYSGSLEQVNSSTSRLYLQPGTAYTMRKWERLFEKITLALQNFVQAFLWVPK